MASEATVGRSTVWGTVPRSEIEIEVVTGPPIFLVGERVDRRRLARLLDGHDGISCAPDSELLVDLAGAVRRNETALAHYGYPEQFWFRRVAAFFDALQSEYANSRRLTRWAAMAEPGALPLIDRLYPRCRVVRVLPATRSHRADRAADELTRRLSTRYYQLSVAELTERPDAAVAGILAFLDPLVEGTVRP